LSRSVLSHGPRQAHVWLIFDVRRRRRHLLLPMNIEIKKRLGAIGAFSSGLVGGMLGTFKEWAAHLSPDYAWFFGGILSALVGGLVFSALERRYVRSVEDKADEQNA
jgi:hypothetical protein